MYKEGERERVLTSRYQDFRFQKKRKERILIVTSKFLKKMCVRKRESYFQAKLHLI